MPRQVTVFFRFDDYSETSPVAVETGLVRALTNHQVCATFGVIPAVTEGSYHAPGHRGELPLGPSKILFLREAVKAGAVEVALHGWNHRTCRDSSPHTEFSGLSPDEQRCRIGKGRDHLEAALGVNPMVFIPPWNTYDQGTIAALTDLGFSCLSANRYGACRDGALRFLPITADVRELRQAVGSARRADDDHPTVGILLHPYDFAESGDARGDVTWSAFEADLRWLREQPDVQVLPIGRLSNGTMPLDAAQYRANRPLRLESLFPPFVRTTSATPFLMSARAARRTNAIRALTTVLTYVGSALLGWAAVQLVLLVAAASNRTAGPILALVIGSMLLALLSRTALRRKLYFRTALATAVLSGMLVSTLR